MTEEKKTIGYTIEIKRGDEVLKTATTDTANSTEVQKALDSYLEDEGLVLDNVPEDITVKASFGDNTLEESFGAVYEGFKPVPPDVAALEVRRNLARIAAVSDLQAAAVTLLSRSEGLKGFTVLFGDDFDDQAASVFANGARGHAEEMATNLSKQFKLEKQEDNLIVIPGRG